LFYHESWQNDICSFRAKTVDITVSFKLVTFIGCHNDFENEAYKHLTRSRGLIYLSCLYQANYIKIVSIVQVYRLQLYSIYYTIKYIV